MKHWPGAEHRERHERAAVEHLYSEIARATSLRDRSPAGSIQRLDAERYLVCLHKRLQRGIELGSASSLIDTPQLLARQAE